jgi:hypothetical protein
MNQKKRIKVLSLIAAVLILASTLTYVIPYFKQQENALPEIALSNGIIDLKSITYTYKSNTFTLTPTASGDQWLFDGAFKIKEQYLALLQTGFARLKIKRKLSNEFLNQADSLFKAEGVNIVWKGLDQEGQFMIVSNPNDPNSCYYKSTQAQDNTVFVAFVPGFTGDISNIFELEPLSWKKTSVIEGSNRTIQSITVNYPTKASESFALTFQNGDYQVIGVTNIDSTKLSTYLSSYEQISVDKYLLQPQVDSIKQVNNETLIAEIQVKLLNEADSRTLQFYTLNKDPMLVLVYINETKEWAYMKSKRLFSLLVKRGFFEKK